MRIILFFILIIFIITINSSFSTDIITWDKDGNIRIEKNAKIKEKIQKNKQKKQKINDLCYVDQLLEKYEKYIIMQAILRILNNKITIEVNGNWKYFYGLPV